MLRVLRNPGAKKLILGYPDSRLPNRIPLEKEESGYLDIRASPCSEVHSGIRNRR